MNKEFEKWLTGFAEGDGTVTLNNRDYPRIMLAQKERGVLDYSSRQIEHHPTVYHSDTTYKLEINGKKCIPILRVFSEHVVSKHFLERLNIVLSTVDIPMTVLHEPTIDWLAGFWDAEGSSTNARRIDIVQKERYVLDALAKAFGGSIYNEREFYRWYLGGDKARDLAREIALRSQCLAKRERLLNNFNGPSCSKLRYAKRKVYNERQRLLQAYIKEHPKVLDTPGVKE